MTLTNTDIIQNSIINTSFQYIDNILQDFQKLQPEFKYTLTYGTNLNQNYSEITDTFNIVMFSGSVDKLPTYYDNVNGIDQLLYAGYLDIALSIINPIPLLYSDGNQITTIIQPEIDANLYQQDLENNYSNYEELYEENSLKIEYGTRMLEALSLYLTRKNIIINNFKISSRADIPIPDGQFEIGLYRLSETLPISIKFVYLNDLGKETKSGEDYDVRLKFLSENGNTEYTDWLKVYGLFEFNPNNSAVDRTFALMNNTTTQALNNQMTRTCSISCAELDIGACDKAKDLINSGNLKALENMKISWFDGKNYYQANCVYDWEERPANVDQFNGYTLSLKITSDVTKSEDSIWQ